MSLSDFFWIALGYVLAALVGLVLGVIGTVATYAGMHNRNLPRKRKANHGNRSIHPSARHPGR